MEVSPSWSMAQTWKVCLAAMPSWVRIPPLPHYYFFFRIAMDLKKLTAQVEKVSQQYTSHFEIKRDSDWFILKLQEELGELTQTYLMWSKKARNKGKSETEMKADFANELADVFAHVLLLATHHDIDLEQAVKDKWLKWLKPIR